MSEEIMSNSKGDEPTAFMPEDISVAADDSDDDEFILELGGTSSNSMLAANLHNSEHLLDMHMASTSCGAGTYLPPVNYQCYKPSSVGNPQMLPALGTHVRPALFTNPYMQYKSPLTPPTPPSSAITLPNQLSDAARIPSAGGLGTPMSCYQWYEPPTESTLHQVQEMTGNSLEDDAPPPICETHPRDPEERDRASAAHGATLGTPPFFTYPYIQQNSGLTAPTPPSSATALPSYQSNTAAEASSGCGYGAISPQTVSTLYQAQEMTGKMVEYVEPPPIYDTHPRDPEERDRASAAHVATIGTPPFFTYPYIQQNSGLTAPTPPSSATELPSYQSNNAAEVASGCGFGAISPQTVSTLYQAQEMTRNMVEYVALPPIYETYPLDPEERDREYKKAACVRERTRMTDINRAYNMLRSALPFSKSNGRRLSKFQTLNLTISYIKHLENCLKEEQSPKTDYLNKQE